MTTGEDAEVAVRRARLGTLAWAAGALLLGAVFWNGGANPLCALAGVVPVLGLRWVVTRLRTHKGSVPRYAWFLAATTVVYPLVALGFRSPPLGHPFDYFLRGSSVLLTATASGSIVLAARLSGARENPIPVLLTWAIGLPLCVAPAIVCILFGPYVFVFFFGNPG